MNPGSLPPAFFAALRGLGSRDRRSHRSSRVHFRPRLDALEGRLVLSATTIAGPQLATYDTSLAWGTPDVATDDAGNSVVVFSSPYNSATNGDIYFQRLNSSGVPVDTVTEVNTLTTGTQGSPKVAMDASGDFVVVWSGANGFSPSIFGQRYDASGNPVGSNFVVGDVDQYYADLSVAMDDDGDFAIAYLGFGDIGDDAIYARSYSSTGASYQSSAFRVNAGQYNGGEPAIAMDADGDFVVTYTGSAEMLDPVYNLFANVYGLSGSLSYSNTVAAQDAYGRPYQPSVAMNSSGSYAVTWISLDASSDPVVYAQEFGLNSTAVTSKVAIPKSNSGTISRYTPTIPDIAIDDLGNFVVTWLQTAPNSSSGGDIYIAAFNASGSATTAKTCIDSSGAANFPAIAITPTGQFIVVYQDYDIANSHQTIYDAVYHV